MKSDSVITERGQITLPKKLRDRFGLRPGMRVSFKPSKKGLLVSKALGGESPIRSLVGIIKGGPSTDDYLLETRGKVE